MKIKRELIAQRDPKSPISEIFRTLRTNIQFMSTNKKLQTLLITSTFPSEGKSWVASNLAVTFAQAGNKVILIDADMRKGRQYTIFGASPRPGLSNYLSGIDIENPDDIDISKYIQKTDVENLLLMPAGNVPPNPSELLVSPQMVKLLEDLKEVCDVIIVDGTPCELVTDSIILSRIVDSTVIVTAHKETKKDNLEKIVKNIQNVGGHLAGVVINKMPVSAKKYNEKYYYYGKEGSQQAARESINEIKRKTSDILKQNSNTYKQEQYEDDNINLNESDADDLERPSFIKDKVSNPNSAVEESNNILNQINSFLDKEKNNLN